jgi:hypothetical protein
MDESTFWQLMMSVCAGLIVGIGSSFAFWWYMYHRIVPKVDFSLEIARRELRGGDTFYQAAFENSSKRKIVDIDIMVRIGVKGFKGATGWGFHAIRTNASKIPDLSSIDESRRLVRIFDTRDEIQFIDLPSRSIRCGILSCRSLEEILRLGDNATIEIHVFGYDAFSGTRKHFSSKRYDKNDIRRGRFEGLNVVQDSKIEHYT